MRETIVHKKARKRTLLFWHFVLNGDGSNWVHNAALWEMGHRIWSFCIFSTTHITAVHLNRLIYSWQGFNYHSSAIIIISFICFWIAQLVFRTQTAIQRRVVEPCVKRAGLGDQDVEYCTRNCSGSGQTISHGLLASWKWRIWGSGNCSQGVWQSVLNKERSRSSAKSTCCHWNQLSWTSLQQLRLWTGMARLVVTQTEENVGVGCIFSLEHLFQCFCVDRSVLWTCCRPWNKWMSQHWSPDLL